MRGHPHLLGTYVPADSLLHRAPLWAKVLGLLLPTVPVLVAGRWGLTAAALAAIALAYTVGARMQMRHLGRALAPLWPLLVILGGFQWIVTGPRFAFLVVGNLSLCVLAARLLTLTTPGPRLLDGLVRSARPFRFLGADPERFGLTVALMMRSLPYLVGSVQDVRDAAMARGLERNVRARVVPVVINAVAYAQRTGDALAARGLADSESQDG
jgi:biotin transport system permease protein